MNSTTSPEAPPASAPCATIFLLGLAGASVGGVVGYFGFVWAVKQGLYAVALPGALLGLGAGLLAQHRSFLLASVCGLFGLALGFFSEWRVFPFAADATLGYFLAHLHQLRPATLLLIFLGGAFGFYLALGRKRKAA